MYFTNSEARARHHFIDRSLDQTQEVLTNPQVALALGAYATELADVRDRLYVANVRHGRLNIPPWRRRSSDVPVIAAPVGESVMFNAHHFARFNPDQRVAATRRIQKWLPALKGPEALTAHFEKIGFRPHMNGEITEKQSALVLDKADIAMVVMNDGAVDIASRPHLEAGFPPSLALKGRPALVLSYHGSDQEPTESHLLLHEYKHVVQHTEEPIYSANSDTERDSYIFGLELEAYHVGALAVRGMEAAGLPAPRGYVQTDRDDLRAQYNGNGDGMFRPSDELQQIFAVNNLAFSPEPLDSGRTQA